MNNDTLEKITAELDSALAGRRFGKLFQSSQLRLVIDFRVPENRFLLISAEPGSSRAHLITRRLKDLEKQGSHLGPFAIGLRKRCSDMTVESVTKLAGERVMRINMRGVTELGDEDRCSLLLQLTGKSSNIFIIDSADHIIDRLRATSGEGQQVAELYAPPARAGGAPIEGRDEFSPGEGESISAAVDRYYLEKEVCEAFEMRAKTARRKLEVEISKRTKLISKLEDDLVMHGDPERWKRFGDLLLANLADAVRDGDKVTVKDYFEEDAPTIVIEADANESLTEVAERYFRRYMKARNAKGQIAQRITALDQEVELLKRQRQELEERIATGEIPEAEVADRHSKESATKKKSTQTFKGARRFISSEGYEILVGKGSKDNDHLTFRVAKSGDLWLHAADYPGSHVVVRNKNRGEIPQRTLIEAAQLAAFYSDARNQLKAAVNYTQKKFVNKPRGAAPGLVSLSGFKTVLVQPVVSADLGRE